MSSLLGKTIVITGVTSGIGYAAVEACLNKGADVFGIARNRDKLQLVAKKWGKNFHPIIADLAEPSAREEAIKAIRSESKTLFGLINNAAECVYETPLELSLGDWRRILEINLIACIHLTQGLYDKISPFGQVINISSINSKGVPNSKFGPYGLTKTALTAFTDSLRMELSDRKIRVSQIAPGLVDTEVYNKVPSFKKTKEKLHEMVPRWLEAKDVAEAITWILSLPNHAVVADLTLLPVGQIL